MRRRRSRKRMSERNRRKPWMVLIYRLSASDKQDQSTRYRVWCGSLLGGGLAIEMRKERKGQETVGWDGGRKSAYALRQLKRRYDERERELQRFSWRRPARWRLRAYVASRAWGILLIHIYIYIHERYTNSYMLLCASPS